MSLLQECGLSKPEERAYEALIRLGATTSGKIAKESKIHVSHIYEILYKLVEKGLATYYLSKNTKFFQAAQPNILLQLFEQRQKELQEKKEQLNNKITELLSFQQETDENNIKIYEGLRGIKSSIEKMLDELKETDTYYVLGAPLIANKKLNAYFRNVHERRIKKKINFKIIYNETAKDFAKERSKSKYTKIKISKLDTPTEIAIYNKTVQIIIFSRKPILIEISNEEISKSFLQYFNEFWKLAQNN